MNQGGCDSKAGKLLIIKKGKQMSEFNRIEIAEGAVWNRNKIILMERLHMFEGKTDCFRSLFVFNERIENFVNETGSVKGFRGDHYVDYMFFDFDGDDLAKVEKEVKRFIDHLRSTYKIPLIYIGIFFSGRRGFHVVVPFNAFTSTQAPKKDFWLVYKKVAIEMLEGFDFADRKIYQLNRLIRTPNTRHSKSGLYKININYIDLSSPIQNILARAQEPLPDNLISPSEVEEVENLNELFNKYKTIERSHPRVRVEANKRDELLNIISTGVNYGERHIATVRLTGLFRRNGFDFDFTMAFMRLWNQNNRPTFSDDELQSEVRRSFYSNSITPGAHNDR